MEEEGGGEEKWEEMRAALKKKRHIRLLIFAGIIGLMALSYFINLGGIKTTITSINFTKLGEGIKIENYSVTIKELNENPGNHAETNVKIIGMLKSLVGGNSLRDVEGYWVWINDNCTESNKSYSYETKYYTAEGIWKAPNTQEYQLDPMVGIDYKYRIECSIPIY